MFSAYKTVSWTGRQAHSGKRAIFSTQKSCDSKGGGRVVGSWCLPLILPLKLSDTLALEQFPDAHRLYLNAGDP